jgi:hypothetical protein
MAVLVGVFCLHLNMNLQVIVPDHDGDVQLITFMQFLGPIALKHQTIGRKHQFTTWLHGHFAKWRVDGLTIFHLKPGQGEVFGTGLG